LDISISTSNLLVKTELLITPHSGSGKCDLPPISFIWRSLHLPSLSNWKPTVILDSSLSHTHSFSHQVQPVALIPKYLWNTSISYGLYSFLTWIWYWFGFFDCT
jgi:hypothetical protein